MKFYTVYKESTMVEGIQPIGHYRKMEDAKKVFNDCENDIRQRVLQCWDGYKRECDDENGVIFWKLSDGELTYDYESVWITEEKLQ